MFYKGKVKGKSIEFKQELPYEEGHSVYVIVESLENGPSTGSPAEIVKTMRSLPNVPPEDIGALERAIEKGKETQN